MGKTVHCGIVPLLLAVCLCGASIAAAEAAKGLPAAAEGPAHSGLALLQLLQQEGALPLATSSAAAEQEQLEALLTLMRVPALLMTTPAIPRIDGEWLLERGGTADHALALLRISSLDREFAEEQKAFLDAVQRGEHHGVILDLRDVDGQEPALVETLTAMLADAGLPLLVLIDANTRGTAESLASDLQQRGAFVMGEPSRGIPGLSRVLPFRDGLYLRLPKQGAPDEYGNAVRAVEPDRDLSGLALSGGGDPWMRQASDALVAIMVLKQRERDD
jgi:hypothetical protein